MMEVKIRWQADIENTEHARRVIKRKLDELQEELGITDGEDPTYAVTLHDAELLRFING